MSETGYFRNQLEERVLEKVNEAIDNIAAQHVMPNMETFIEQFCLKATNEWGDAKGDSLTFTEYLVERATVWVTENVNRAGESRTHYGRERSGWSPATTRIAHMIDSHLKNHIDKAMAGALGDFHSTLCEGLTEAVRISLTNVLERVKVDVSTKR